MSIGLVVGEEGCSGELLGVGVMVLWCRTMLRLGL